MTDALQLTSQDPADTVAIGAAVASLCRGGDVVAMVGELGAGKTQFVRGLARGLGLEPARVSSPTFVLMHEYEPAAPGGLTLVHIDAYRVASLGDLESLGWDGDPDLRRGTVVAVEWADRLAEQMDAQALRVVIDHQGDTARRVTLTAGSAWRDRWVTLAAAVDTYIEVARTTPCPICRTPVAEGAATFPFCSPRCRTIDLGRWIDGRYAITRPVEQSDLEEGVD